MIIGIGIGLVQGTTKVREAIQILWSPDLIPNCKIKLQPLWEKLQEESLATAQHMAEESTHQVMKEIVFDDDYDLNGFNNQNLE